MDKNSVIYVAGHTGLIGSAVVRLLERSGYHNIVTASHDELELVNAAEVDSFFRARRPEYVVLAAGKVGGIEDNQKFPADFINTNLAIQLNVLQAAQRRQVTKLLMFASSCMYPRECRQPAAETELFAGKPEPTSMAYAVSKMVGMQMCLAYNQQYGGNRFIPLIPNSVFGPNDNFDLKSGHVLSALVRRFHEAKKTGANEVTLWGSGNPKREFIHADDVARACLTLLEGDTSNLELPLNIGSGAELSIRELAQIVAKVVEYEGGVKWDATKADGAPRKLLDSSRMLATGWRPQITFFDGLSNTYDWFVQHEESEY
jgi:GDP-L-fucose synthase